MKAKWLWVAVLVGGALFSSCVHTRDVSVQEFFDQYYDSQREGGGEETKNPIAGSDGGAMRDPIGGSNNNGSWDPFEGYDDETESTAVIIPPPPVVKTPPVAVVADGIQRYVVQVSANSNPDLAWHNLELLRTEFDNSDVVTMERTNWKLLHVIVYGVPAADINDVVFRLKNIGFPEVYIQKEN
ncbi:MAG: hypothetical protein FWD91_02180 [Treponema sp.]|nr:hypothetical protein [Treponema sp.]